MAGKMLVSQTDEQSEFILDVGGEGRHPEAWNLNPSLVKTIGNKRGQPIPQHISGRAEDIPLGDGTADRVIVERTPLQRAALKEIARVVSSNGTIILRHAHSPYWDPHALAKRILPGRISQRTFRLAGQVVQETEFRVSGLTSASPEVQDHESPPPRASAAGRDAAHRG